MTPTEDDLKRDLAADLEVVLDLLQYHHATRRREAHAAAIRRALAAEAELAAVRQGLADWVHESVPLATAAPTLAEMLSAQMLSAQMLSAQMLSAERQESERLRQQVKGLEERVVAQSELLAKRAGKERHCDKCYKGVVTGEPNDGDSTCARTWPCPDCNGTGRILENQRAE